MELVFEIGCEDLPARFVRPALEQLEQLFRGACEEQRISFEAARVLGTPRRLTLLVEGLAEKQEDLSEERTGPPVKAAYRDGEPTKAAEGFARGQGVAVEDLYTVDTERGEYVAAKVFEEGAPTAELLPTILDDCVGSITFQKSMR
jgi:glycyl-tRNA synthetase beta chain